MNHEIVQESLLQVVEGVDNLRVQSVEPIQSGTTKGGGKKEAHAFVVEALALYSRLKRMDVG